MQKWAHKKGKYEGHDGLYGFQKKEGPVHVKRNENMVGYKQAYSIAKRIFDKDGYCGVAESKETDKLWVFAGKMNEPRYGGYYLCIPKDGNEAYYGDFIRNPGKEIWENAQNINF